ncbi:MAG TPA: ankyrin repeat domain-containing protein [Rickettsiales bacterium]|nr:ankyrin repeat domain-containing protein [Rickettsiales bacterium]
MRILKKTALLATVLYVSSGALLWAQDAAVPPAVDAQDLPVLAPGAAPAPISVPALVPAPSPAPAPVSDSGMQRSLPPAAPVQQSLPPISPLPATGAEALHLPGEQHPGSASSEMPQLAAPSMPPAPAEEAPKQTADTSEAPKETPVKSKHHGKHKKHAKHHHKGKVMVAKAIPVEPVTSYRLPSTIYNKSYDKQNRHLPMAYSEQDYDTMVYTTILNDDINGLRSLLNTKGRDIDMINAQGDTPLIAAVKNDSPNAVRLLVKRNANRAIEDRNGYTALQLAEHMGDSVVIQALITE